MKTNKNENTLTARLSAVLAELAAHHDARKIAAEAAEAAMSDCNGFDERGEIAGLALTIAKAAADWQAADCTEQADYWHGETEAPSDRTAEEADECRRYFAAHAAAHDNTSKDLARLAARHAAAVALAESIA